MALQQTPTHASTLLTYLDPALADERVDMRHCRASMQAWADQARAEFDRALGRRAPEVWRDLVAAWPYLYRPEQIAYCQYRAAQATMQAIPEDRQGAEVLLISAHQLARRLGAQPLLTRLEALAARCRITLPARGSSDSAVEPPSELPFGLSARELEVLSLVAKGFSNVQISGELFISVKTVSAHVSHILKKMRLASRGQAAQKYHDLRKGTPTPGS